MALSGMESLMRTMFRAAGVDPEAIIKGMSDFIVNVTGTVQRLENKAAEMEQRQVEIERKLDLILAYHQGRVIDGETRHEQPDNGQRRLFSVNGTGADHASG